MDPTSVGLPERPQMPIRYSFGDERYSRYRSESDRPSPEEPASILVADARLSDGPISLRHALEALPDATFVPDHHSLSSSGERILYLSVAGASQEDVDEAFMLDPTVVVSTCVATFPDYLMYRVQLTDDAVLLSPTSVELGARPVSVRGTDGAWNLRLQFPDRDALVALRKFCEERGIRFGVDSLYRTDRFDGPVTDLTDPQWTALLTAFEDGYYDIPRKATQDDLARKLGISTSAVSHRLRRATGQLVREVIAAMGERSTGGE